MAETIKAKATIDISGIPDTKGLGDTISHEIGNGPMALTMHSSDNKADGLDKTADIEVEGMSDPELAAILTSLNFRLVDKAAPIEKPAIAQMPTPTLNGNTWNMPECLNWLEATVKTATDKTKAYKEGVAKLIDAITIADEYSKRLPMNQITGAFHAAFAGEIAHREPHGVEIWKHRHGIELPETNHV